MEILKCGSYGWHVLKLHTWVLCGHILNNALISSALCSNHDCALEKLSQQSHLRVYIDQEKKPIEEFSQTCPCLSWSLGENSNRSSDDRIVFISATFFSNTFTWDSMASNSWILGTKRVFVDSPETKANLHFCLSLKFKKRYWKMSAAYAEYINGCYQSKG